MEYVNDVSDKYFSVVPKPFLNRYVALIFFRFPLIKHARKSSQLRLSHSVEELVVSFFLLFISHIREAGSCKINSVTKFEALYHL